MVSPTTNNYRLTTNNSQLKMKNDLYLRALKGETVERPPVWMMRQAGRFLPEFQKIKAKYDFFTRCRTPELASEITVQPIRRFGMDAAILFSDILVIPQAMNIEVEMKPNFGPYLPNPVRNQKDVDNVIVPDVHVELDYVMQAVKATKELLNDDVPLIGFAIRKGVWLIVEPLLILFRHEHVFLLFEPTLLLDFLAFSVKFLRLK